MATAQQMTQAARQVLGHDDFAILGQEGQITRIELADGSWLDEDVVAEIQAMADTIVVPPPVPEVISTRQFFYQAYLDGRIPKDELLGALKTGDIPTTIQTAISAGLPQEMQEPAEIFLIGAVEFRRDHPVTSLIGAALGMDAAAIDEFWRKAATL